MTMDRPPARRCHDGMTGNDLTRAEFLLRLARRVTGRHELHDVLSEVVRCLRPVVGFGGGSIQLLDDEGWIRMAASDPIAPARVMAQRIPLATSVAGRVILTEQPVYLEDIAGHGPPADGKQVSAGVRSYLAVPLVADGRAIGVLQVDSVEPDAWTAEERTTFLCAAPIVAAAIQNSRAHALAGQTENLNQRLNKNPKPAGQLVAAVLAQRMTATVWVWSD